MAVKIGNRRHLALSACALVMLSGCAQHTVRPVTTVTVSVPAVRTPSTPTQTPTPTPTPTLVTRLRMDCATILPLVSIEHAVGHVISGRTSFVVGVPEKSIGRLDYLNCRYGMRPAARGARPTPVVEIGISLYNSPAQAARRLSGTIADYLANGAEQSPTTVAGHRAVILTGGLGDGFDVPLIVVASGQRTVAVSLAPRAAGANERTRILAALATLAIRHTGG